MTLPSQRTLLILCTLIYAVTGAGRGLYNLFQAGDGRDYATFHYAVQEAWDGGDPYDGRALTRRARAEGVRTKPVHPYFYPPPFLLGMLWAVPLPLMAGYVVLWAVHQLALLAVLLSLHRWFDAPPLLLGVVAVTMSGLTDNAVVGQVNLPVLALLVFALWRESGPALGAAAMVKMSPALHLVGWAVERRGRAIATTLLTALALTVLALPLVGPSTQLRFYTEILPLFGDGEYNGLRIPVTMWANHSLANLIGRFAPGPDVHHLSTVASVGSKALALAAVAALIPVFQRTRGELGRAGAHGALVAVMLLAPAYTWEHHLVFLLLPIAAVGTALHRDLLPRQAWVPALLAYTVIALPLPALRVVRKALPAWIPVIDELKLVAVVVVGLLSAWVAWRARGPADKP